MSGPRVLLVIGQLDMGGAERQVTHLARSLRAEGFETEVAVFYPEGHFEPTLVEAGIRVYHVRRTSKIGHESIFHLLRILREGRHEIVHSFLWPANWRARLAGVMARTPVIVSSTRSVETWLRPYHVLVDRVLARRTDAIVVNAEAIKSFLERREKIPPSRIRVIPNGIDVSRFINLPSREEARARIGLPTGSPVVLIVGNLQPEKNHEDFIRTAARMRERIPEARFVLVGGGDRRNELAAMARDLRVEDRVVWAGFQPDIVSYLAACDVFMNTSRREGCCNAILEAMAAARPVVAYAVGGNPELVRPGTTGDLAAFGDVDALSAAVEAYLRDGELASRHGAAARRYVEEAFSLEAMVARTAGLYRELMTAKGIPTFASLAGSDPSQAIPAARTAAANGRRAEGR